MTPTAHMRVVFTHSLKPSVYVLSLPGIRWVLFGGGLICIIISKTYQRVDTFPTPSSYDAAYVAAS